MSIDFSAYVSRYARSLLLATVFWLGAVAIVSFRASLGIVNVDGMLIAGLLVFLIGIVLFARSSAVADRALSRAVDAAEELHIGR